VKKDPKKRVVGQVGGWRISSKNCFVVSFIVFSDILTVRDLFHKMNLVRNLVKDEGTMIGVSKG